jgi:hypothetical protein
MFIINPQYVYLVFCVGFLIVWTFIYWYSPGTRTEQLWMSVIAIPGGPLSEVLYLRDYWYPPSAFPIRIGSVHTIVEDMMFAFTFTGITTTLYQIFTKQSLRSDPALQGGATIAFSGFVIASLFLVWWGINSIYATSVGFLVGAAWMVWRRPDLIKPSIGSGTLISLGYLLCLFGMYTTVANIEELSDAYWTIDGTPLDIRLVGVPATELIWAFSFGTFFGPLYAFIRRMRYV